MTDVYDDSGVSSNPPAGTEDMEYAAASFLGRVLGLEDDTDSLAGDLSVIKRDRNAAIYTIQLESSVGPAAFLVYGYLLNERGGDGHTGQELFDSGLATLQQAAERNSPGPRAVAHGASGEFGFIIATTPGTFRALAGDPDEPEPVLEPDPREFPNTEATDRLRRDAADELLHLLRSANERSQQWLQAIQTASQGGDGGEDLLAFNESETELALFLLDNESIGDLLQTLNILVSTAQQHAANAID
ncbi:MAG TPA: hypothetical protein VFQ54_12435 [Thermomicrobiales bacterium]|nr:hypothetical protein [Thermomicrobiales bacterium]